MRHFRPDRACSDVLCQARISAFELRTLRHGIGASGGPFRRADRDGGHMLSGGTRGGRGIIPANQ